jgi:hypothetical protein
MVWRKDDWRSFPYSCQRPEPDGLCIAAMDFHVMLNECNDNPVGAEGINAEKRTVRFRRELVWHCGTGGLKLEEK